jgi:hypothetical protein
LVAMTNATGSALIAKGPLARALGKLQRRLAGSGNLRAHRHELSEASRFERGHIICENIQ